MEYIIEKFLKYLDERRIYLINEVINISKLSKNTLTIKLEDLETELITLKGIKDIYLRRKEEDLRGLLYTEFSELSKVLENSNLPSGECTYLVFWVLCRNIRVGVLEYLDNTVDLSKINEHEFKTLSKEDLSKEKLLYNNLILKDKKTKNLELEWTEEQLEEFKEVAKQYIIDISDLRKEHQIINDCYLSNRKNFNEDDIKKVISSLENLGITQPILEMIESSLNLELTNRIKKEQYKISTKKPVIGFNKDLIPDNKDYNQMIKSLNNMVDLREMMPKDYYSLNQIIEIISWMMKTGIKQEDISKFLWNTEIFNQKREINIITKYLELYDKLKYYANKLVLFNELNNIEEYFQSLFITNDEDYEFWKNCLEEELINYLKLIPGGYMYEFNTARKKIKKKV